MRTRKRRAKARPLSDAEREAIRAWALEYVRSRLAALLDPWGELTQVSRSARSKAVRPTKP
jgi:hypothetical protein